MLEFYTTKCQITRVATMASDLNSSLEFYINGVAILVVASLGLLGNVLSIFLFSCRKMKMNPTFTSLLCWLAVLDSLFLVSKDDLHTWQIVGI